MAFLGLVTCTAVVEGVHDLFPPCTYIFPFLFTVQVIDSVWHYLSLPQYLATSTTTIVPYNAGSYNVLRHVQDAAATSVLQFYFVFPYSKLHEGLKLCRQ